MPSNNKVKKGIQNLNNITRVTNSRTYGISKDLPGILTNDVDEYIDKLNTDREKNKSLINSRVSRDKLNRLNSKNVDIYDLVNNQEILNSIESTIGSENLKFAQMLKDYEIIERCLPQVHRVIKMIKNNIVSPDSMGADNILGITLPSGTDKAMEKKIRDLVDKYEINQRIQNDIVMDYLIASVKYVTVVPYTLIPDMLHKDPEKATEKMNLTEAIEYLDSMISNSIKPLSEAAGELTRNELRPLVESTIYDNYGIDYVDAEDYRIGNQVNMTTGQIMDYVNAQLENIEFIDGAMGYYRNAILNEAVNILSTDDKELKSMKTIINKVQKEAGQLKNFVKEDYAAEGLIDDKTYKDIKKNVNFKGAHIEYLPASQTIAFKLRDTIVGYFYVEDRIDPHKKNNTSSIMDKINASVYIQNTKVNRGKEVEEVIIRNISEKLVKAVNTKFINDNYEDIDIIYEFVKANELHKKAKRVVFFHPDDICEFRRSEGSIMKNCMFFAKLLILNLLNNIITKVTRGSDRNLHFVKTGLTTDIEGSVNDTIRAIKQNQIRYSDIGTINEIFNIVGSNTDVFMPVSVDGERPIETETISGQNVDMNDDFTTWMMRSIVQSFGVPASVIDDLDGVEFAKTISMSNLDMAKAVYDAQVELNPVLTKMFRLIVKYEFPEYDQWDEIETRLNPPSIIVYEMNRDRMSSIEEVAEKLAELMMAPADERDDERRKRLFKLEYYKHNMTTWDWEAINSMYEQVLLKAKEEAQKQAINSNNNESDEY